MTVIKCDICGDTVSSTYCHGNLKMQDAKEHFITKQPIDICMRCYNKLGFEKIAYAESIDKCRGANE